MYSLIVIKVAIIGYIKMDKQIDAQIASVGSFILYRIISLLLNYNGMEYKVMDIESTQINIT